MYSSFMKIFSYQYEYFINCSFFFFSIIRFVNKFLSNFICRQNYSINQRSKFMS